MEKKKLGVIGPKKLDFSFLNKISSIYMIFRSVAVFLLFIIPQSYLYVLIIYALTWLLDSLDDNVIEKAANIKLKFDDLPRIKVYNILDKISDYFVTTIIVFWSHFFLPEFFKILFILEIFRLVGLIVFFSTQNDSLLILFPNVVHYLLGSVIFLRAFFPESYWFLVEEVLAFVIFLIAHIIVGLLSEYLAHIAVKGNGIMRRIMERF